MAEPRNLQDVIKELENWGYLDLITKATNLNDLQNIIADAVSAGILSTEMADHVFETYAWQVSPLEHMQGLGFGDDVIQYLSSYTDKNDLAYRLQQLNLQSNFPQLDIGSVYGGILKQETPYTSALRNVAGQQQRQLGEQEARKQWEAQQADLISAPYIAQDLSDIYNSPYITQEDMTKYRDLPVDQFIATMKTVNDMRAREAGQLTRAGKIQARGSKGRGEEQAARALLTGMQGEPQQKSQVDYGAMPGALSIIEPYLESTGLAPGTRLRSFLESEINKQAGDIQSARADWWRKSSQAEDFPESFEEATNRMTQARDSWGRIAATAPTSEYTSDTFWGPGGLAQLAADAAARHQGYLEDMKPEDYWQGNMPVSEVGEDPLKSALRNIQQQYKAKYYRMPGTGLGGRLTPGVRFR